MAAFKLFLLCLFMNVARPKKVKIADVVIPAAVPIKGSLGVNNWEPVEKDQTYRACAQANVTIDSYLVLPFINTEPANEITVEFKYSFKTCARLGKCEYSLGLYAKRTNLPVDQAPNPEKSFLFIDRLKNVSVVSQSWSNHESNVTIGMQAKKGIFLALRDTGMCGMVTHVSVWYLTCHSKPGYLLNSAGGPAPNGSTYVTKVHGDCVNNAVPLTNKEDNVMDCFQNGTVQMHGGCQCESGFEMAEDSFCRDCKKRTFKSKKGNEPCLSCGKNVEDGRPPRESICKCLNGYFRPESQVDQYFVDCEEPPSTPRRLNASRMASNWAVISWQAPARLGTGDDVTYVIKCKDCTNQELFTSGLEFNLTTLKTYTFHEVTVYTTNNVTRSTGKSYSMKIRFRTLPGLPSAVQNLSPRTNSDGSITVTWEVPEEIGGPDLKYYVTVNANEGKFQLHRNLTIHPKAKLEEYRISVRSHTSAGFAEQETINFKILGAKKVVAAGGGIPVKVVIAISVSLGVLIIIAVLVIIYICKRRIPKHLQPVRLENGEVILPRFGRRHMYVDPAIYENLTDAVRDFAKELQSDWVRFNDIIGGGEFGDVYKGTLQRPLEEEITVAIKTLKANAAKKSRDDFLAEAAYMGQFDDPNVVSLEGVIVKEMPFLIVIEYMVNGSLVTFLRDNDSKFSVLQLLSMARGVSSGMTYLSELSFIHRDLAARNILVNEDMVCKVADFGMSRELTTDDVYSTTGGKIPVRWTAPEAIEFKKFTTASDVWSYGILLWEIMSYGERPYWDWGNYDVIERLASGYRLPPPMGCPKVVHDLMLNCWNKDRVKRPKFRELRSSIDDWIRSPDLLMREASVVTKRDEDLDYASMTTLKEWLDSINMGEYMENFTKKGYVTPRQILEFTDAKLQEIGIFAIGHRRKITKSIRVTRRQLEDAN